MRVHTNKIERKDLLGVTRDLYGVHIDFTQHGSRSHRTAFEFSLEGNGYRKNTGKYGASEEFGATWDEWGVVIARLFDIDPDAMFGTAKHPVYRDAEDFRQQTAGRFEDLELPEDTHKRHNWQWHAGGAYCKTCTAEKFRQVS